MKILVTGGAGYIGSVAVKQLRDAGHSVVVIDNMLKGVEELIPPDVPLYKVDIVDVSAMRQVFEKHSFDAVMHFASAKAVGESMVNLGLYSKTIRGTINILDLMVEYDVGRIVFSSSAAVYGLPKQDLIHEDHPKNPINYYGFCKLECERIFKWYSQLKGITYVALRYFNVAGDGGLQYIDPNALNLFPIVGEVIDGTREKLTIFGNDYNTRDGTNLRDYVHVTDLVRAHLLALDAKESASINLGSGKGYTVLDVVKTFEAVLERSIPYEIGKRRAGDPDSLVTDNKKAKKILGWEPELGLHQMVESTVAAYSQNSSQKSSK